MADIGSSSPTGVTLDQAPPQPPGSAKRATLMDNQRSSAPGAGLGADAANPQIVALQGLAMMDQGSQLLSSAIPALAPPLMGLITQLKQVVPQAMADQIAGVDPTGAGAQPGAGGPPGAMPPGPPPQAAPAGPMGA